MRAGERHGYKAVAGVLGCGVQFTGTPLRCCEPMNAAVHTPTLAPPDEAGVRVDPAPVPVVTGKVTPTPMWYRAVEALRADGWGWHNGPYPFRKYVLSDDGSGVGGGMFDQCLKMLLFSGQEFMVECRRPEDGDGAPLPYRTALVTYARFYAMGAEALAEDLSEENGA